jgi:hypothetical protein
MCARAALCACALLGVTASAHHSTAPYDLLHGTIIEGRVTRFAWENPHGHIYLDVTGDENAVEPWTVEIESPGVLMRLGWTKGALKPGDRITISGSRAKNGSFNMKALTVQFPDGRRLPAVAKQEN